MSLVLIERPSDGVALLRLNQPERRNALATPMLSAVADALDEAAADASLRCVVITGDAKAFAAGADINELADTATAAADTRPGLWTRIRAFPKPLVAAVEGWCLGAGNELLMCCDLSIASTGARFGQPETNLGIMPGAGGVATLTRLVGRTLAMKMVLLGDRVGAAEALAAGLVTELAEPDQTVPRALAMAARLASRPPLALRTAKACVLQALELAHAEHLKREREAYVSLLRSDDKQEGVAAFLEKRAPVWTGR
jgi:enoyl-CoA hydratase